MFHSIRKSFTTSWNRLGSEGITADIIGHENTITYGLYSGSSTIQKFDAIIEIPGFILTGVNQLIKFLLLGVYEWQNRKNIISEKYCIGYTVKTTVKANCVDLVSNNEKDDYESPYCLARCTYSAFGLPDC